jgi:D-sedoheptulose 7-phosphate isomerase
VNPTADSIRAELTEAQHVLNQYLENPDNIDPIADTAALMAAAIKAGGKIIAYGNGGSMCDAIHFAEEFTGRYRHDRPAYLAMAIPDASHLSCVGKDYGFNDNFLPLYRGPGATA